MRILIVNDDGIQAKALPHLIRWARTLGEVTCVAPKHEQSGKSQAIDFTKPVEIKEVEIAPDITVWAMDSTPADCVRFGVTGLGVTYDLILSGINRGYNLGDDIAYSGTVGAINEGGTRLLEKGPLYNVNFPREATPKGIRVTHQGGEFYSDAFEYRGNDMYMQVGAPIQYDRCDLTIDIDAVRAGYISVSPMAWQRTDWRVYEVVKDIAE